MRCPVCNNVYPAPFRFCAVDGAALVEELVAPPSTGPLDKTALDPEPETLDAPATGDSPPPLSPVNDVLADLEAYIGDAPATDPGPPALPDVPRRRTQWTNPVVPGVNFDSTVPPAPPPEPIVETEEQERRGVSAFLIIGIVGALLVGVLLLASLAGVNPFVSNDADPSSEFVPPPEPVDQTQIEAPPLQDDLARQQDSRTDQSPGSGGTVVVQTDVPGGVAAIMRTARNELYPVVSVDGTQRRASRALSSSTTVDEFRHRTLAGREVIEISATDNRWATTYYWEYGSNEMHFVATDQRNGEVNVSSNPGSKAVIQAAMGFVPERTWRSQAEQEGATQPERPQQTQPQAERPAQASNAPVYVILGAYEYDDDAGLQQRLRQVSASGQRILTGTSEGLGLTRGGYRILYLGPFDGAAGRAMLTQMQRYASDAYLSPVR